MKPAASILDKGEIITVLKHLNDSWKKIYAGLIFNMTMFNYHYFSFHGSL